MPFDLTLGQAVVISLRLVVPLLILRRPLLGGVLAMLLDGGDVIVVDLFGPGGMGNHYHRLDKYLDLYYLALEAAVSLRWAEMLPRRTSIALFLYRLLGVVLFEATGIRTILFFFPNLFENFFLFYLLRKRYCPGLQLDGWGRIAVVLALLYIPKFGQEWVLHVVQAQPWNWFKAAILQ